MGIATRGSVVQHRVFAQPTEENTPGFQFRERCRKCIRRARALPSLRLWSLSVGERIYVVGWLTLTGLQFIKAWYNKHTRTTANLSLSRLLRNFSAIERER